MKRHPRRKNQFQTLEDIEKILGKRTLDAGKRTQEKSGSEAPAERTAGAGKRGSLADDLLVKLGALGGGAGKKSGAKRGESGADALESSISAQGRDAGQGVSHRMSQHSRDYAGAVSYFLDEYGRLLIIPALAIVLLAVILLAGKNTGSNLHAGEEVSIVPEESAAATESDAVQTAAGLKDCEIPEIQMLVGDYFAARQSGDAKKLYALFDRKNESQLAADQKKLEAQRSWIQSFNDIHLYELPGLSADARLILVTYSIDFRRTDTLAPGIMYCYVQKNADGKYVIAEQLRKETLDYINEELAMPQVEALQQSVNKELSKALNEDSTLALIYTSFVNGNIYSDSDLESGDQEVDLYLNPSDSDLVAHPQGESGSADAAGSDSGTEGADSAESADNADVQSGGTAAGDAESAAADDAASQETSAENGAGAAPEISIVTGN